MKKIPYGISNYEELITEGYYYVDKTSYLKDLEDSDKTLMYLRPRRFGKTLFTSMMFYYYDIKSSDKFDTLFKDTAIYKEPTKNKNNYYVLRLDFSGMSSIDSNNFNEIKYRFKNCVLSAINEFKRYYQVDFKINEQDESADIIMQFFDTVDVDAKLYVIIDEYDNFTNSILEDNADIFKMILGKNGFVKDFYARIKKARNTIVDRVFVTGVCSISVDAMTSGFNVATDLTNRASFNAMTALTHDEVRVLIKDIDSSKQDEIFNEMVDNYDGYKFSESKEELVFNPTLVMYYLRDYYDMGKRPTKLFDKNILSNFSQIENIIKLRDNNTYNDVLNEIIDSKYIKSVLVENFDMDKNFVRSDIISLLYYFGYLTIEDITEEEVTFRIPNKMIEKVVRDYFTKLLEANKIVIDISKIEDGINEMANEGKIDIITKEISSMLEEFSNRMFMSLNERTIQALYSTHLRNNNVFKKFDEFEVKEGYTDLILFGNSEFTNYDILIELKYISKDKYKGEELEKEIVIRTNKAKKQLLSYMNDDRIKNRARLLKAYVVVFIKDRYLIEEV